MTSQAATGRRTLCLRQATGLLQGGEVHSLEDLAVQLLRLLAVKGHSQQDEGIRQPLAA